MFSKIGNIIKKYRPKIFGTFGGIVIGLYALNEVDKVYLRYKNFKGGTIVIDDNTKLYTQDHCIIESSEITELKSLIFSKEKKERIFNVIGSSGIGKVKSKNFIIFIIKKINQVW